MRAFRIFMFLSLPVFAYIAPKFILASVPAVGGIGVAQGGDPSLGAPVDSFFASQWIFWVFLGFGILGVIGEIMSALYDFGYTPHSNSVNSNFSNNASSNNAFASVDEKDEFADINADMKDKFGVNGADIIGKNNHGAVIGDMIKDVEEKINAGNVDEFVSKANKAVEYAYLSDVIKDDDLDKYQEKIERLTAIINLANGTTFEGEKNVAVEKAAEYSRTVLNFMKKDLFGRLSEAA